MAWEQALAAAELPAGAKKAVKLGEAEILLVHTDAGELHAFEAKCPHAGAPLEQGALCNGRLICPWHAGTFELATGRLVEPPPLRSLRRYQARIEDGQILVNPEPENATSLANHDDHAPAAAIGEGQHVVTVGGGTAAAAAVCALRQGGFAGRITMIDPVADEPVDRTNLSKMALAGKKPIEPLLPVEQAEKLRIERIRSKVAALDGQAGSLRTEDGQDLAFDAALLAPGGKPRKPGLPGEDLPQVHTLRNARDVEAITAGLGQDAKGKRVVLVGDSFIAFEAASALTGRGAQATVVCRSPQPFANKFGEGPAGALLALHRKNGVELKLGAEAREIGPTSVTLQSGETLPADVVILAVGVEPATRFNNGLQLEEDGGVPVDASLRAGRKLWVGGDIAAVNGTRIEHWRVAEQHGRVFAAAVLKGPGVQTPAPAGQDLHEVPFFWTAHFGKQFRYVGHAEKWDSLEVDGSLEDTKFLAYYTQGNAVKAVFGCGQDPAIAMLAERMRKTLTLEEARRAAAAA